ncbi:Hypothetical predicted protein [Paramuricea clavata]|uniref:Integrase p58-like C-terminal domain-containing protein n=1 Tax=Paramuricea clavata TaxID=317549 RepID=A0A6S7K3T6_PARCT|nr:Hypothetical predicted protein [Paramuricea clavata]
MFGRETRIPVDLMTPESPQAEVQLTTSEYAEKLRKRFERTYELTRVNTKKSSERYKDYYDAKAKDTTYNVGEKYGYVVYRIEKNANKRNRLVVHYNRLKPCFERPLKSLPNRPPNETKLQSKETPETRKENVENCSGQTPQTEPPTNGGNDEDEWTDGPLSSMEQNNQRDGSDETLREPVEGNEGQSQAPPERPARTRKKPAWLRDYE